MGVCKVLQDVFHFQLRYLIKENVAKIINSHWTFKEDMSKISVHGVHANGMAQLAVGASSCTGMTKFATGPVYTETKGQG